MFLANIIVIMNKRKEKKRNKKNYKIGLFLELKIHTVQEVNNLY